MIGWRAFLAVAMVGSVAQANGGQDIVLSGQVSPASWTHHYSMHCAGDRDYDLELTQEAGHAVQLLARYGKKVEVVKGQAILKEIAGFDLYSVRMDCTEDGGEFHTALRRTNGRGFLQTITVDDAEGVKVFPATAVPRGGLRSASG